MIQRINVFYATFIDHPSILFWPNNPRYMSSYDCTNHHISVGLSHSLFVLQEIRHEENGNPEMFVLASSRHQL